MGDKEGVVHLNGDLSLGREQEPNAPMRIVGADFPDDGPTLMSETWLCRRTEGAKNAESESNVAVKASTGARYNFTALDAAAIMLMGFDYAGRERGKWA